MLDKTSQSYLKGVAFDGHAAQARNPHPAGTFRDTPEQKAKRLEAAGRPGSSPLYTPRNLGPSKTKGEDGAFRR